MLDQNDLQQCCYCRRKKTERWITDGETWIPSNIQFDFKIANLILHFYSLSPSITYFPLREDKWIYMNHKLFLFVGCELLNVIIVSVGSWMRLFHLQFFFTLKTLLPFYMHAWVDLTEFILCSSFKKINF